MECLVDLPTPLAALLPRLRARARRLAATPSDADDLVQEATLRLWQALQARTDIDDLDRYAMTVLHNLARQRWRRGEQTEELFEDSAQTAPDAPARMAWADLQAAIARLPSDQAILMQLVAEGETSPADLARRTGLRPGTVMSRLARARASLRIEMGLGRDAPVSELY